jgi:hypothetical protein
VIAAQGERVSTMVDSVVQAFVDAKMERADVSMALYAVATGREEAALVKSLYEFLVFSAMGGVMRAILEGGAPPKTVRSLRKQLGRLCRGFLTSAAA